MLANIDCAGGGADERRRSAALADAPERQGKALGGVADRAGRICKKGYALGRVGISSRHTLALVNRTGDATLRRADAASKDLIVMTVEDRFRGGAGAGAGDAGVDGRREEAA